MRKSSLLKLTSAALFTALIFTATAFTRLPVPLSNNGYVHFGDTFVFLAGCFLPPVYAAVAAGMGAAFADLYAAAQLWIPFTIIIKAVMAAMLSSEGKILRKRNIIAVILASAVNITGYYFAEVILFRNWQSAFFNAIPGLYQFFGGILFFFVVGAMLDKIRLKERI